MTRSARRCSAARGGGRRWRALRRDLRLAGPATGELSGSHPAGRDRYGGHRWPWPLVAGRRLAARRSCSTTRPEPALRLRERRPAALDPRARRCSASSTTCSAPPTRRGFRGHLGALGRGEVTTGFLKFAGTPAVALVALASLGPTRRREPSRRPLVIAAAANLGNLFDRAPGRVIKVLCSPRRASRRLRCRGALAGPLAVVGAACGLAAGRPGRARHVRRHRRQRARRPVGLVVVTASVRPGSWVALAVLVAFNLASEFVSFSKRDRHDAAVFAGWTVSAATERLVRSAHRDPAPQQPECGPRRAPGHRPAGAGRRPGRRSRVAGGRERWWSSGATARPVRAARWSKPAVCSAWSLRSAGQGRGPAAGSARPPWSEPPERWSPAPSAAARWSASTSRSRRPPTRTGGRWSSSRRRWWRSRRTSSR